MIRAISFVFKFLIFSALVLVLGNWIKVGNKTISDQVKTEMAQAERSEFVGKVRGWANRISQDSRLGQLKKIQLNEKSASPENRVTENITPSERQKLKSLIEELNRPNGH